MVSKNKFEEKLANCDFAIEYTKAMMPILSNHLKVYLEKKESEKEIDFDLIGTNAELQIKEVSKYFGPLQTVVHDLEMVLIFLKLKERNLLNELYPSLELQEDYYAYHFENYIIRINTICDNLGKLGNLLYNSGIPADKCNGYNFKEAIKSTDPDLSNILEELLQRTKEVKDKRHKKIHVGETPLNYLDGIAFYNDVARIINIEADPLLEKLTDKKINEAVDTIENEIDEILDLTIVFLNHILIKFKDLS